MTSRTNQPPPVTQPGPGVPAPESGRQTTERILDAAEKLFAERGFRAASVREITQVAQCNLAAVNYHFGGKQSLYREVLLRRVEALRARRIDSIRRAMEGGKRVTPEALLESFAAAFLEPLLEETTGQSWMKLMSREMFDPQLPAEFFFTEMIAPVNRSLREALLQVCPGLDDERAELCIHSIVAQLVHIVYLQRLVPISADPGLRARYALPRLVRHVIDFSLASLHAMERNLAESST